MNTILERKSVAAELSQCVSPRPEVIANHPGPTQSFKVSVEALNRLADHLRANSDLNPADALLIQFNNRQVFFRKGNSPESFKSLMDHEYQLIQSFLNQEAIRGRLQVFVNGASQSAYQINSVQVVCNQINYRPPFQSESALTESNPGAENAIKTVQESELSQQLVALQQELAATRTAMAAMTQRLEAMEMRQTTLEQAKPSPTVIQQVAQATIAAISTAKPYLKTRMARIKQAIAPTIHQFKAVIAQAWMTSVVNPSLTIIANHFGTDMPDGTKVFQTQGFQITFTPSRRAARFIPCRNASRPMA